MQSNEAKTHFAGVLREVEEGQEILITKHKKVIAKIIPYSEESTDPKAAVEAVKALKKLNLTQKEIGEYRTTGRL
jgi:prevent-host-death family protein